MGLKNLIKIQQLNIKCKTVNCGIGACDNLLCNHSAMKCGSTHSKKLSRGRHGLAHCCTHGAKHTHRSARLKTATSSRELPQAKSAAKSKALISHLTWGHSTKTPGNNSTRSCSSCNHVHSLNKSRAKQGLIHPYPYTGIKKSYYNSSSNSNKFIKASCSLNVAYKQIHYATFSILILMSCLLSNVNAVSEVNPTDLHEVLYSSATQGIQGESVMQVDMNNNAAASHSNWTQFNWSYSLDEYTTEMIPTQDDNAKSLARLAYWINAVLTNIIVILGLVGNSLTIIILTRRAMRSSTNIYLTALAVWDTVVLISTALLIGLEAIQEFTVYKKYAFAYVVSYFYPIALIAQTATIWLTVSFTVERFIAVCHPLKAARMCTIKRAKIVIFCVSLGASLYNIPRWFEYTPVYFTLPSNETIIIVDQTEFVQNELYTQIYFSWLYVPIMCIIPLATLSVLNTCLVIAVRRSQKQRKNMNVRQSRENNVTIMLATVVVVFIMCQVPALVYNLAYAIDREYVEQKSFGYRVLSIMRNFLVTFNSAINFLLYCALGQKFRRIFLHTFCKKCINDTYMPMSGIHQNTSMVQISSHAHKSRQYFSNNHTLLMVKNRGEVGASSSTTQTTGCTSSSQESALLDPNMNPHQHNSRQMRTYSTVASSNKKRDVLTPSHTAVPSHVDSDTDAGYDMSLEHLLNASERSDSNLVAPYQTPNKSIYGIRNTAAIS